MTKQEFGMEYLLHNMESDMELLPYVVEIEFNMTVDQFLETYILTDDEGYYCDI
jgi:hypothetical protein